MSNGNFYSPDEVKPLYGEIIPAYQAAFAGEPWYEVSKCEDRLQRCLGGLSSIAVGQTCQLCNKPTRRPAYEPDELVQRFEGLAKSRPTDWYTEWGKTGLALAAVAWEASPETIASEKYSDVPVMKAWLPKQLSKERIVWLDEVFANRTFREKGNLRNFRGMCEGFMERLDNRTLAFRTINERMIAATKRDFAERATVFEREREVPDRREFVVIRSE